MSIAVLTQVYDEARRLAVAGSVVAKGDFRLKKLLPPLEQAGAKAPVFAKVGECARAVIDGTEESSAENLLELTALVSAVLYTQGETGLAGELQPIESIALGGETAQTSARLLKPLLEALTSTGSGRLELVKDAHERGAFRDLRLVKPALDGLDDPYPEVAEFLADKVLPLYGKAILPELRTKFDPKGTKGHPRRLKLMHDIDPPGTRELVKQALEGGSKEVKVAAIACLGAEPEDLAFLIEQVATRVQDLRGAAYHALAAIDDPAAVAVLAKALAGKDLDLASRVIARTESRTMPDLLASEVRKGLAEFDALSDKTQVSDKVRRLCWLVAALPDGEHPTTVALMRDLIARRRELPAAKGGYYTASDVGEAAILRMIKGPDSLRAVLARAHAGLDAPELGRAVWAGRQALPPAEVYDLYAPYLTAANKKGRGDGAAKREEVIDGLGGRYVDWYLGSDPGPPLDPRWLDLAVRIKHPGMIAAAGRPGHAAANAFVAAEYDRLTKKTNSREAVPEADIVAVMVRLQHPAATDALLATFERTVGKTGHNVAWFCQLIPWLPKSAAPRLEGALPRLVGRECDQWLAAIQELHDKQ